MPFWFLKGVIYHERLGSQFGILDERLEFWGT